MSQDNDGLRKCFGPYSKVREEPFKDLSMEAMITLAF